MIEKKVVVNLAVGVSARRRLDELARSTQLPLGVVLERAIMAYEPAVSVAPNEQRMTDMELRLAALESRLTALEAQSLINPSLEPEAAEIGSCAVTEPLPEEGTLEAAETVDGDVDDMLASPDLMEKEAAPFPSISSLPEQPIPPIETAIKELGRQGHGQQAIAHELNRRGYRTVNGTLIQRGYVGNRLKSLGI